MAHPKHTIVVGLGFGDEGKGTFTEYFAKERRADATIRFNGGQQATHNVVRANGEHHTFSQFGAATLDNIPSYLSRFCTFNPFTMFDEAVHLHELMGTNPYNLLKVSENALMTTPLHVMVNRKREEARGEDKHGSVGLGFGETISYSLSNPETAIRASDMLHPHQLHEKLCIYLDHLKAEGFLLDIDQNSMIQLRDAIMEASGMVNIVGDDEISKVISEQRVVFEGAQGLLLDQDYGFHPHTTWSSTTPVNARTLLEEAGQIGEESVVGVIRSYHTRHGQGPFPTENMYMDAPEESHNSSDGIQGAWRTGALDLALLRYATSIVQPDEIALSFADLKAPVFDGPDLQIPTATNEPERLAELESLGRRIMERDDRHLTQMDDLGELIRELGDQGSLYISTGPTIEDKKLR